MLTVKKLRPDAILPTVAHPGEDLAYDLYSAYNVTLHRGTVTRLGTGIAALFTDPKFPACRYGLLVRDRSSMASEGVVTSGGVIDAGYRGEIVVMLTLMGSWNDHYTITKGDKIAQMIPTYVRTSAPIVEVDDLPKASRGDAGFGSTGK